MASVHTLFVPLDLSPSVKINDLSLKTQITLHPSQSNPKQALIEDCKEIPAQIDNSIYNLGLENLFPWKEMQVLPVQWHALCLGLFASIIAPFGGFFASGFKRAFKIKDFGDSIPGHGGMTDRMDCQMVMAVFAYIYHQSFVTPQSVSVEMILDQILMNLSFEEQKALYTKLAQIIQESGFGGS